MITNDGTIIQIKHDTPCEIAKRVFSRDSDATQVELR